MDILKKIFCFFTEEVKCTILTLKDLDKREYMFLVKLFTLQKDLKQKLFS